MALALAPVLTSTLLEVLGIERFSIALIFVLLGAGIVAERGRTSDRDRPWWPLWWMGTGAALLTQAGVFWLPGPSRPAMVYRLWPVLVAAGVLTLAFALWQEGAACRTAFALFPWSIEMFRFVLVDDVRTAGRLGVTGALSLLISIIVFVRVQQHRSKATLWSTLAVGTGAHIAFALILSLPVPAILFLYPIYLGPLLAVPLIPLMMSFGFDILKCWGDHTRIDRAVWGTLAILLLLGIVQPWLTGDALPAPARSPVAAESAVNPRPVIVDTDLSHDDYAAILFLLQRSDVDVQAITLVHGVTKVEPGVENAHRLLALAERTDIPIAAGAKEPLFGDRGFPTAWNVILRSIFRPVLPRPDSQSDVDLRDASALIRQVVRASDRPVTLIALGPLTNVALALEEDPSLATRLDQIVVSGGAIDSTDQTNPHAGTDWNFYVDPPAADRVLRSEAEILLVPVDVMDPASTHSLLLTRHMVEQLETVNPSSESRMMAHIARAWLRVAPGDEGVPLWDVTAAALAVEPNVCTQWHTLSIRVELRDDGRSGRTLVDESVSNEMLVCLNGDQAAFEETILEAVTGELLTP